MFFFYHTIREFQNISWIWLCLSRSTPFHLSIHTFVHSQIVHFIITFKIIIQSLISIYNFMSLIYYMFHPLLILYRSICLLFHRNIWCMICNLQVAVFFLSLFVLHILILFYHFFLLLFLLNTKRNHNIWSKPFSMKTITRSLFLCLIFFPTLI